MRDNLTHLIAVIGLGLAALDGSAAASTPSTASPEGRSLEIDVRPAAGPGRGAYDVVIALRDTGGARLAAIELDLERGEETRSTRGIPGGGELAVELALDGGGRTLSYSTVLSSADGGATTHRARIQLDR